MVFWMLLSLFYATCTPQGLRNVILSAITFAIATLTKENAFFLGPVILYMTWGYARTRVRIWSISQWIAIAAVIIALYPLYASLKGELFASGTFLGGFKQHVSLIQTTIEQGSRGVFAFPWNSKSDFYVNLNEWIFRDPFIIIIGAICLFTSLILNERYREIKAIALTALAEIIFLARGKLVIDYYILAILPLLAMTIGIMIARPLVWAKNHISPYGYSLTIAFLLTIIFVGYGTPAFSRDETTNQQKAITWIEQHISKNAYIAIDNYAYPELHDVDGYKNADYEFKVQYDPQINKGKYHQDYYKTNYLLITHEEIVQMASKQLPFIQAAFNHSQLVADFTNNTTSYIDIGKLISTNGDWAQIYKVDNKNDGLLVDSWRSYKLNFIRENGQVVDPSQANTTSEGESYALLRSITMNDKIEFDRVWNWTQKNIQIRKGDSLFTWKISLDSLGANHIDDTNSASDADEDIALALYQAYQKWGDKKYLTESQKIVSDIWKKEVVRRNNEFYLISSPEGTYGENLLVNPSYIAPANYKIFAKIDPKHNWQQLVNDSYSLLTDIQKRSSVGLPTNWVAVAPSGDLISASHMGVQSEDYFGYDAFRVDWRMADDVQDPRAQKILTILNTFYQDQWSKNNMIASEYDINGVASSDYADIPSSAGAVIALHAMKNILTDTIYKQSLLNNFNTNGFYWGQQSNYYSQNWGAFAVQYLGVGGPNSRGDVLTQKVAMLSLVKK